MKSNTPLLMGNTLGMLLLATASLCLHACSHRAEASIVNTQPVSFKSDIMPILTSNCAIAGCHTGSTPQSNLGLDSSVAYSKLLGKGYVVTGQPQNSIVYLQMSGSPPIMPPTGLLPKEKQDKIYNWILQGAENN